MQTCSLCNTSSPDNTQTCPKCGADLRQASTMAVALEHLRTNPRVKNIRLVVSDDSCPSCRTAEGTYAKDHAPVLPHQGCSHERGCRCFYEPMLDEIYP